MEILTSIASYLNRQSLCNFRLVNWQCASAGVSYIPQNGLSVLNTVSNLEALKQLLKYPSIARNTRKLSIVQARWPVCSRKEWEVHPLLYQGNDRSNPRLYHIKSKVADDAFAAYRHFIEEELARRYHDDVHDLFNILRSLPNLHSLSVTNIQIWRWHPADNTHYHNLIKRIWIGPHLDYEVSPALQTLLLAVGTGFKNLKYLGVRGEFNPSKLDIIATAQFTGIQSLDIEAFKPTVIERFAPSQFASIQTLEIESFRVLQDEHAIQRFLLTFPNLVKLSMSFLGWGPSIPTIIGRLLWHRLQVLRISDIWASEDDIFDIFNNHIKTITCFNLENASLTRGSWRALFTRIRKLGSQATIMADGELYGRKSKHTLDMRSETVRLKLEHFLKDRNALWPFEMITQEES